MTLIDLHRKIYENIKNGQVDAARALLRDALKKPSAGTYYLASFAALNNQQCVDFLQKAVNADPDFRPAMKSLEGARVGKVNPICDFELIFPSQQVKPSGVTIPSTSRIQYFKKSFYIQSGKFIENHIFDLTLYIDKTGTEIGLFVMVDENAKNKRLEAAAELVCNKFAQEIIKAFRTYGSDENLRNRNFHETNIKLGVLQAQLTALELASGGVFSLTAVIIYDSLTTIAHLGDMRVLLLGEDGKVVKKLTTDYVAQKKGIGATKKYEPDILYFQTPYSHTMLLCTKGVWSNIDEHAIAYIVSKSNSLEVSSNEIVKLSSTRGKIIENRSVILIKFPEK